MSASSVNHNRGKPKNNLEKAIEKIFFEKQQGSLCGQHCLNNALQGQMFSPVDLSTIAQELDEKERQTMAEKGTDTAEYKAFIKKPSSNFDDSGYFSVQVLSEALKNVNLELVSLKSEDSRAANAQKHPAGERLYVCHMEDHWFALRRFGPQWFNLNSFLSKPELVTDTYLSILIKTLQTEGYVIFVVFGELPECEADNLFTALRRGEDGKYLPEDLEAAGFKLGSIEMGEEESLKRGIELSLAKTPAEAIRAHRAAFLNRFGNSSVDSSSPS